MQTISPSSSACPASRKARRITRAPPCDAIGMTSKAFMNGLKKRVGRIVRIDDEPNGPIQTGDEQESVDERHVIRDEQGASPIAGHVPVRRSVGDRAFVKMTSTDRRRASGNSQSAHAVPDDGDQRRREENAAGRETCIGQARRRRAIPTECR